MGTLSQRGAGAQILLFYHMAAIQLKQNTSVQQNILHNIADKHSDDIWEHWVSVHQVAELDT